MSIPNSLLTFITNLWYIEESSGTISQPKWESSKLPAYSIQYAAEILNTLKPVEDINGNAGNSPPVYTKIRTALRHIYYNIICPLSSQFIQF